TYRYADDGTVIGYQGVIRDITAQKQAEKERLQLNTLQQELTIAQEIQQSLLPLAKPDWASLDVICYSAAAQEVGGDFYTYHATTNKKVLLNKYILAIGDVSGKGVSAALLMATSLSRFDASLALSLTPPERLAYLDKAIQPYIESRKQNCALCYVEIVGVDTVRPVLKVANAGAIPPYLKRADGSLEWPDIGGFALGQGLGAEIGYQEIRTTLSKGDMIIMTSDGVVEANNIANEMFGFKRLEQAIASGPTSSAEAMLEHLKAEVGAFVQSAKPHDDLTIIVARI
ncbi:MAG: PP2C family protein-serine/threonine phosphatase, partial [Chloroflexota bacterium]